MQISCTAPVERLPEQPWLLKTCVQADQRDQLARFWLAAPDDLLPSLWSSNVGEVTKEMVRALKPQTSFTPEQVALRDAIGARLQAGFQSPMAIQLLLANFLYSPPGLLTIANADKQLPQWLITITKSCNVCHVMVWHGIPCFCSCASTTNGSSGNHSAAA